MVGLACFLEITAWPKLRLVEIAEVGVYLLVAACWAVDPNLSYSFLDPLSIWSLKKSTETCFEW
jgi:hypothetical protein